MRTLLFLSGAAVAAAITFAVVFGDYESTLDADDGASIRHTVRGDSSEFSLREDGLAIKANWRGKLKLDKTGDAVAYVEDYLEIELEEDGERERLRLTKDGRDVEASYWRDGNEQAPGDETDTQIGDLVVRFLRASAFEADMRVAKILESGGVEAVFAEIEMLSSDYAVRRYAAALSEMKTLDGEQIRALIDQLDDIEGDHDIAQALLAITLHQSLNDAATLELLGVAENIDSDYEKRRVLTAIASKPLSGDAAGAAVVLLSTLQSDHDFRVSAESVLAQEKISANHVAEVITAAAGEIDSDHDLRLILTAAAPRIGAVTVADAWLYAFGNIDSDYDKRVALEAAATVASEDEALLSRLHEAATGIDSEYDRQRALAVLK